MRTTNSPNRLQRVALSLVPVVAIGALASRCDIENLPETKNCTIVTADPTVSDALERAMQTDQVTGIQTPESVHRLGQLITSKATGLEISVCSMPSERLVSAKAEDGTSYTVTWDGSDVQPVEILDPSDLRPLILNNTNS